MEPHPTEAEWLARAMETARRASKSLNWDAQELTGQYGEGRALAESAANALSRLADGLQLPPSADPAPQRSSS